MADPQERFVNVIPTIRIKKERITSDDEDSVHCRLCSKTFANERALSNHARMEHVEAYAGGDPTVWTKEKIKQKSDGEKNKSQAIQKIKLKRELKQEIQYKTEQMISSMEPTSITSLASNDVSYIIIKSDDIPVKKKREKAETKKVTQVVKKEKEAQSLAGPFECLQPSTLVAEGTCHQIFFSCCEYSLHYRDEHNRRRKGVRCQVCEKPLLADLTDKTNGCELCGASFDTSKELSDHMCLAHIKLKPFECTICHKRFTQQGGVQQHMRMHTGDRPFNCTFCPKAFTQKSGLDQHLRIHTKVKPYRCVVCGKSFCQSIHLKQHMRTHTNVTPFQCGICNKKFKQSSHLNYHLKNHNPINMTEEQKQKYSELIGMISKEIVEVEIVQNQPETEIQDDNVDNTEYTTVMDGVETWCVDVEQS